ncbi:MAG TPA: polyhydroxyalkanoic acid system family protein [Allosphingosinicella sp.]|nr:polyhydroxyalkanoic acid system family protein [Allosphingosinicella sp.]
MTKPVSIDLPHRLGAEEAKRRMQGGIGRLKDHVPGGAAEVRSRWEGNRMYLDVQAMGQEVTGHIDVEDSKVRLELMLPAFLALFAGKIEGLLRSRGTELLEDKSPGKGG